MASIDFDTSSATIDRALVARDIDLVHRTREGDDQRAEHDEEECRGRVTTPERVARRRRGHDVDVREEHDVAPAAQLGDQVREGEQGDDDEQQETRRRHERHDTALHCARAVPREASTASDELRDLEHPVGVGAQPHVIGAAARSDAADRGALGRPRAPA